MLYPPPPYAASPFVPPQTDPHLSLCRRSRTQQACHDGWNRGHLCSVGTTVIHGWTAWKLKLRATVDGSEIPVNSPVEVGSSNPNRLQSFKKHPNGGWPWDFWTINSMAMGRNIMVPSKKKKQQQQQQQVTTTRQHFWPPSPPHFKCWPSAKTRNATTAWITMTQWDITWYELRKLGRLCRRISIVYPSPIEIVDVGEKQSFTHTFVLIKKLDTILFLTSDAQTCLLRCVSSELNGLFLWIRDLFHIHSYPILTLFKFPNTQCMVYLPTFTPKLPSFVGKTGDRCLWDLLVYILL